MDVAYITRDDANDISVWSGTTKNIFLNLKDITKVDNIIIKQSWFHKLYKKLNRKKSLTKVDEYLTGQEIKKNITKLQQYDVLFLPVGSELLGNKNFPGSEQLRKKIIYLSDATFDLMQDYYPEFKLMSKTTKEKNEELEKESLQKASDIIYSSEWAKRNAHDHYQIEESKLNVIHFGANLPDNYVPKTYDYKQELNFLIVGVDWKRKGIERAVETVKLLNKRNSNYKFKLNVVGFNKPESLTDSPEIKFYGRLNKHKQKDLDQMIDLYQKSDLFIFPTIAECSPIVLCEAAMYGLPVVSINTGGISSYVTNESGRLLPLSNSSAEDFCKVIEPLIYNEELAEMSRASRSLYEQKLNWKTWKKKVDNLIKT